MGNSQDLRGGAWGVGVHAGFHKLRSVHASGPSASESREPCEA